MNRRRYITEARPELAIVVEMEVYDDLRNAVRDATLIPLRRGEFPSAWCRFGTCRAQSAEHDTDKSFLLPFQYRRPAHGAGRMHSPDTPSPPPRCLAYATRRPLYTPLPLPN